MKYLILFILLGFASCGPGPSTSERESGFEVTYYPSGEKDKEIYYDNWGRPKIINIYNKKGELVFSREYEYGL